MLFKEYLYLCRQFQLILKEIYLKNPAKIIILYPFAIIYGIITGFRNWLFDQEILPSTLFNIPIISVDNLVAGGTGKTPHTEYLLALLQTDWKTAMLSRGYKRKTKGFQLANNKSDSYTIGDESFQLYRKFPEVTIAVDEKRVEGVKKLQELIPDLQLVILDDAFQHRYIQAGLSILLTEFSNLYTQDMLLPAGRLREWKSGSTRANIIVVTKCPEDMKPIDMRIFENELKPQTNQLLFFSSYIYDEIKPVFPDSEYDDWTYLKLKESKADILLVAGIASPEPILIQLAKYCVNVKTLFFEDHHAFQQKDFVSISKQYEVIPSLNKIILVTEKDAARIISNPNFPETLKSKLFTLPIRVEILHDQETMFIQKIKSYVIENSRDR